jgi:hypothetical protein
MTIIVFSKKNCGLCDALKDKLKRIFKVEFVERDIEEALAPGENWRETDVEKVTALHCMVNNKIPMCVIDEVPYDYVGALRVLKRLTHPDDTQLPGVDWTPKPEKKPEGHTPVEPLKDPMRARETPEQEPYPVEGPPLTFEEFLEALRSVCMDTVEWIDVQQRWSLENGQRELGRNELVIQFRDVKPLRMQRITTGGPDRRQIVANVQTRYLQLRRAGQI